MDFFWNALPIVAGLWGGAMLCAPFTRRMPLKWLLATTVYLCCDLLALIHAPRLHHFHRNWTGKLASLAVAVTAMFAFRLSRAEVGLTGFTGRYLRWAVTGITVAAVGTGLLSYVHRNHNPFDAEAMLYQATMPGLAEELCYRGVAFALLLRGYMVQAGRQSAFAVCFITSLTFALLHGFSHDNAGIWFSQSQFIFTFLLGGWLAFLRWRTGSLLAPVLSHNAANTASLLAGNI